MRYKVYEVKNDPNIHGSIYYVIDTQPELGERRFTINNTSLGTTNHNAAHDCCKELNRWENEFQKEQKKQFGPVFTRNEIAGLVLVGLILLVVAVWASLMIINIIF